MKRSHIRPEFIELAPPTLEEGVLYISQKYKTTLHKCCCGCGETVVLQLTPAHWQVSVQGGKVSLNPSVGNWGMRCQSHYWIRNSQVVWARGMSAKQIAAVRARDKQDQAIHIAQVNASKSHRPSFVSALWLQLKRLVKLIVG